MERLNNTSDDGVLVEGASSSSSVASSSSSWSMLSTSSPSQEHQKGVTSKRQQDTEMKTFCKQGENSDAMKVDAAEVVRETGQGKRRKIQPRATTATINDSSAEENLSYEFVDVSKSNTSDNRKSDETDECKRPATVLVLPAVFLHENNDDISLFQSDDEIHEHDHTVEKGKDDKALKKSICTLKDDPEFQRYFKMLKLGLPIEAVKHALKRDGKDPDMMDDDQNHKPSSKTVLLEEDPQCTMYLQTSEEKINCALKKDGDIDLDHNKPLKIEKSSKQRGESDGEGDEKSGAGCNGIEVKFKDDAEYERYFKMLKIGLPTGAVKNALQRDGKDPSIMNTLLNSQKKSSEGEEDYSSPLTKDQEFAKYFKMLRMGLPIGAVKNALQRDGKDPSILDLDPDKSLLTQTGTNSTKKAKDAITPKLKELKVRRNNIYWNPIDTSRVAEDSLWGQIKEPVNIKKDSSECESLLTELMDLYPKEQINGFSLSQSSCDHDNDEVHKIHRAVNKIRANSVDSNALKILDPERVDTLPYSQRQEQSDNEDSDSNISGSFDLAGIAFTSTSDDNIQCTLQSPSKTNVENTATAKTSVSNDEMLARILQEDEDYLYALNFGTDNDTNADANFNTNTSSYQDVNKDMNNNDSLFSNDASVPRQYYEQHNGYSKKTDTAWDFVQSVIQSHKKLIKAQECVANTFAPINTAIIEPIAFDSMYDVTKNMIQCKEDFQISNRPVEVTLAYHYTHQNCVDNISQEGLVASGRVGFFGEGIYLANNACAFRDRGSVGIIVAILKGKCERVFDGRSGSKNDHDVNTFIGNKGKRTNREMNYPWDYRDEIVLQESRQCIPIIKFDSTLVETNSEQIWLYHKEVQHIIDVYFNDGATSLLNFYTKSDIFPPDKIFNRSLSHFPRPPRPQQKSHFDEIRRDDAAAYLLLDKSMQVEDALKLAGFVSSDVQDLLLQKDVSNLVFDLRKNASSSSHHLDPVAMVAADTMTMTHSARSLTIRHAMQAAGFTNIDLVDKSKRSEVLKCLAFDNVSFDLAKKCMKLTTAAQLLVLDRSLTKSGALELVGFDDSEAHDPNLQKETQRRACEISIQTGSVRDCGPVLVHTKNSTISTLSDNISLFSKLDKAAKILAAAHINLHPLTTNMAMNYGGLSYEEINNSHYQLHTRIKASFLRKTLDENLFRTSTTPLTAALNVVPSSSSAFRSTQASTSRQFVPRDVSSLCETVTYTAPVSMVDLVKSNIVPATEFCGKSNENNCSICFCEIRSNEQLSKFNVPHCNHTFHHSCVLKSFQHGNTRCPICLRLVTDEPQGFSPSGSMVVSESKSMICSGFKSTSNGTILIQYNLHGGVQKEYHPNQGVAYSAESRVAYLPNNMEGQKLLKRLKYAFSRGLTFTIGTSLTTGRPNSITWGSIHHKTSTYGGSSSHGFPDDSYFKNCHSELDALGVPTFDAI